MPAVMALSRNNQYWSRQKDACRTRMRGRAEAQVKLYQTRESGFARSFWTCNVRRNTRSHDPAFVLCVCDERSMSAVSSDS